MSPVISILGLGYIGLPTAVVFANAGLNVIGVDINPDVVKSVNDGEPHIVEPDLQEALTEAIHSGRLRASTAVVQSDVFVVAVPTPFKSEGAIPSPDLSYVKQACDQIAAVLRPGNLVILESTAPVGSTEQLAGWLSDARPDLQVASKDISPADGFVRVAYCPERVLPGKILTELKSNDRIIGGITEECSEAAADIYRNFVEGECITTNARTAEMCKLTENASRDVALAFANELSIICDGLNINVWELISLANRHPRVNILNPGPGVGGHCIAVDPWFIVNRSPDDSLVIQEARKRNDSKPQWVIDKIRTEIKALSEEKCVSVDDIEVVFYGLAFKANIDDLRESPSLKIVSHFSEWGRSKVYVVEPHIPAHFSGPLKPNLIELEDGLNRADLHVLLVDHDVFKGVRPTRGKIIDTRGVWDFHA